MSDDMIKLKDYIISGAALVFLVFIAILALNQTVQIKGIKKVKKYKTETVTINSMQNFSGKTKDEIYQIRKQFVNESFFKNENYTPSEEVFGAIEDNLPWRSIYTDVCAPNPKNIITDGLSEESRYINNPSMLIGIQYFNYPKEDYLRCDGTIIWTMPYKITYVPEKKFITAYYKDLHYLGDDAAYILVTLNAQDFGYRYGKMYAGTEFLYKQDYNISNNIIEFRQNIHKGFSCEKESGCNNASPYMPELVFAPRLNYLNKIEKSILFKLWKEMPENDSVEPDMTYKIVMDYTKRYYTKSSGRHGRKKEKVEIKDVPLDNYINIVQTPLVMKDIARGIYYKKKDNVTPVSFNKKIEKY